MKLLLILLFCASVNAQTPATINLKGATSGTARIKPTEPAISSEELLKIRNLTYEQSKRVVITQQAQATIEKAKTEWGTLQEQIDQWVMDQAKTQKIDMVTHYFDLDELKFKERPKPEKKQ